MAEAERILHEIGEGIDELQAGISRQSWRNVSRNVFANALDKSVSELQGLYGLFAGLAESIEKEPAEGKPDLRPFLKEMEKLLELLEKNLEFERQRKSRARTVNELETDETPDLYADLEQRILGLLLKARYSLERATIFLRKQGFTPLAGNSTARQVMQVLERKEDELQDLREKYEDVRKKSYLGYFEEETVADIEQQLGELGRKMAVGSEDLEKSISFHKSQVDYVQNSYAELKEKLDSLKQTFSAYSEKAEELIKDLKKERDYAKKVVLEVEHETMQLRNSYTHELLGLQENKLSAKAEVEKKFEAEFKRLHGQLAEQSDIAKHFKNIAESKLKKEEELEEKIKRLTLLLKTKEKHEAVKRQFLKKTKKSH